jgi:hypothetical protein
MTLVPGVGLTAQPSHGLPGAMGPPPAGARAGQVAGEGDVAQSLVTPARAARMAATPRPHRWPVYLLAAGGLTVLVAMNWALVRGTGEPAQPASPTGQAGDPSLGAMATVEIDSRPPGAMVLDASGTALGSTPLSLRLPRSARPASFTLSKTGFQPLRYEVVPDRDSMATLELRAQ